MSNAVNSAFDVAVRVRPALSNEGDERLCIDESSMADDFKSISITQLNGTSRKYLIDNIFWPSNTTSDIYNTLVKDKIEDFLNGINICVFAYGQTSSGKTHTMLGDLENHADESIVHLLTKDIFENELPYDSDEIYEVSFVQIYNEKFTDLLEPQNNIHIQEIQGKPQLIGACSSKVTSYSQALDLLQKGAHNRKVSSNGINQQSSRGHTIFIINRTKTVGTSVIESSLYLTDLAGSERTSDTQAEGQLLVEATKINQSLSVLARIIRKLGECSENGTKAAKVIGYRESVLTRLLQPGLGGNARSVMICCVTPVMKFADQTSSTLAYAQDCKKVVNYVSTNIKTPADQEVIALKAELKKYRDAKATISLIEEELKESRKSNESLHETISSLEYLLEKSREIESEYEVQVDSLHENVFLYEQRLTELNSFDESEKEYKRILNDHALRLRSFTEENESLKSQIESLKADISSNTTNSESLQLKDREIANLEKQIEAAKNSSKLLSQILEEQLSDLKSKIIDLEQIIVNKDVKYTNLNNKYQFLQAEVNSKNTKIEELEQSIANNTQKSLGDDEESQLKKVYYDRYISECETFKKKLESQMNVIVSSRLKEIEEKVLKEKQEIKDAYEKKLKSRDSAYSSMLEAYTKLKSNYTAMFPANK